MRVTNPRIPLTILGLAASCGLVLATHSGQTRSGAAATASSKLPAGSPSFQWHWQNPLPQGNNLRGASFVDANTGTVVGEYGAIVRTTDGGSSWTIQVSGTTQTLWAVSFTDVNNGTAVGEGGTILRTTDVATFGSANQAEQLFSFGEFRSATLIMERLSAKAAPFLEPLTAETAGSLNRVGPGIHYSVFHLSMRIQEQRWAERAESAEKAPFSEQPMEDNTGIAR
jgi:hypothetical protein